jgi:hypothetical protein
MIVLLHRWKSSFVGIPGAPKHLSRIGVDKSGLS